MSDYTSKLLTECHAYIEDNCKIERDNINLKSGNKSSIYYNIKEGIVRDSYFATSICNLINCKLKQHNIVYDTVAGVALGGVLISDRLIQFRHFYDRMENKPSLNYLVVRSKDKSHGIGDLIIGNWEEAENVVIIEDIVSTGESAYNVMDSLRTTNPKINIVALITIIDRTSEFKSDNIKWVKEEFPNCKYLHLFKSI